MTPLLATIIMMCSPQPDKQIKHTCIHWMRREVYYYMELGLIEEQALEIAIERLPQELEPK